MPQQGVMSLNINALSPFSHCLNVHEGQRSEQGHVTHLLGPGPGAASVGNCKVLSLQGADGGGSSAANGPGVAPAAPAGGSRSSSRNLGSSSGEKEEGKKVRRQWESWSTEDKNTFFEGLYEVSFLEPAGLVGLPPHTLLGGPRPCSLTLALHLLCVTLKAVSS